MQGHSASRLRSCARVASLAVAALLCSVGTARAQAVLKVGDDVSFRFGALFQGWADWTQDPVTQSYSKNLYVRRIRVMLGGQVAPKVTFFLETDSPNLGKSNVSGKTIASGFLVQDAWAEWKPKDAFALDAGLMFVPVSRNGLQSAAQHLTLDYGTYTFLESSPTQSSTGRDTGFQAKGNLAKKRLEYRVGAFQGFRNAAGTNGLRVAGRLQYDFLDPETGFFYPGTTLGKKKVLALGGGFDRQQDYRGYAADAFLDHPLGKGAVTAQFDYYHWDGGTTFKLPAQNDVLAEAGYYVTWLKLLPFLRFESQRFSDEANKALDQTRLQGGLTYYPYGHNFNVKAAYTRIRPSHGTGSNAFTIQLQAFYY